LASKFVCRCGAVVRTNLYEGHGLHLLVPEALTDLADQQLQGPCGQLVDELVSKSKVVATCPKCGTVAFIDSSYEVTLYAPVGH